MSTAPHATRPPYATTPCKTCGAAIVFASVRQPDGTHKPIAMDPVLPVFHRIVEYESSPPRGFWIEDRAPAGEGRQSLARHRCAPRAP